MINLSLANCKLLKKMYIAFFILFLLTIITCSKPRVIKIGAIFETADENLEYVFNHAIYLNQKLLNDIKLSPLIEKIIPGDSLQASAAVCKLLEQEAVVIIGPKSAENNWIVKSIANRFNIPHFLVNWDFANPQKFFDFPYHPYNYSFNLHPNLESINQAFFDYVDFNQDWRSFIIVYDTIENFFKIKDVLLITSKYLDKDGMKDRKLNIKIKQYQILETYTIEKMFKEFVKKRDSNFIISVDQHRIPEVLNKAKEFNLVGYYYNYIFSDLDLQLLNFSDPAWFTLNISSFRLFDAFQDNINIDYNAKNWITGKLNLKEETNLTLEMVLIYDAIQLFIHSLKNLLSDRSHFFQTPSISCERTDPWHSGQFLLNYMKMSDVEGITGPITFNHLGQRDYFGLDLIRLKEGKFIKIGTWNKTRGIEITFGVKEEEKSAIEYLKSNKLKLIVAKSEPYVMKKSNYNRLRGDEFEKYEGFCIDLLKSIKSNLNISGYELYAFKGKGYGGKNENGSWTGMIAYMMKNNYDLAITDLTITHERQTVVDFTIPFMTLGISILYSKPKSENLNLWAFLDPFSLEVWFYVGTAFIGVSLIMYIISRISPYEWIKSHPCEDDPVELQNTFSLGNCLWFTLGSIMQQGSDLAPKAPSTRALASVWSFFTLIMVSSYTANLAAFLTVSRMDTPITNAEELAMQTRVAYGCSKGGSTRKFFRESSYPIYQRMYSAMESSTGVYTEGNMDGVRRVLKGNYAFLMEDTSILYNVNRYCNLTQIGGQLDRKGYGLALRQGSPFRTIFSNEILKLAEKGALDELKTKWFIEYPNNIRAKESPNEAVCTSSIAVASTSALDIDNVGGVFILLLGGLFITCIFVAIEFVWKTKKVARHERDHSFQMMCKEVWNICRGTSGNRIYNRKKFSVIESQSVGPELTDKGIDYNIKPRYQDDLTIPEFEDDFQTQIF